MAKIVHSIGASAPIGMDGWTPLLDGWIPLDEWMLWVFYFQSAVRSLGFRVVESFGCLWEQARFTEAPGQVLHSQSISLDFR